MVKLGYSLGVGSNPKYSIKDRIKILLSVESCAVEVGYAVASRFKDKSYLLDNEDIQELKKFEYRSIHAPVVMDENDKNWIRYPSKEGEPLLYELIKIADKIDVDAIIFHPDLIDNFKWLNERIGKRLAFENMDSRKSFGKTIFDMEKVFSQAPEARWVCDVNHIYTIDHSMILSEDFHRAFGDKLCHYHLSAYNGLHDSFHMSHHDNLNNFHEDIILKGIKDFSKPIIHEGRALKEGEDSLLKENKYVLDRLDY